MHPSFEEAMDPVEPFDIVFVILDLCRLVFLDDDMDWFEFRLEFFNVECMLLPAIFFKCND